VNGLLLVLLAAAPAGEVKRPPGEESVRAATSKVTFLEVRSAIPDAVIDLRYATDDNFMKQKVYPDGARCLLLQPSLDALAVAAAALRAKGYRLKLYDCYRPLSVQWLLWKVMPVPGYVADPRKGSNHNRGAAVDLSLVTLEGAEVEMPTGYDAFTKAAHQGYAGGTATSRAHREVLREAMVAAGFTPNPMEWWHFDLKGSLKWPVRDEPMTAP
jgi:D-alanyl-D-alanine dipeptidase